MKKEQEFSPDEVSREIDKGIAGADVQRADELGRLQTVLEARDASARREHARLTDLLGADHPRVAELATSAELNRGLRRDVAAESERARTKTPDVDDKAWALHGFVRDVDAQGVAGLTVALYDERANWVEQLGFTCTGDNGYFRLSSPNSASVKSSVRIHLLDKGSMHIYTDQVSFTPTGGQVDYREIVLSGDAGASSCAPPAGNSGNNPPPGDGTLVTPPGEEGGSSPVPDKGAWMVSGRVTDKKGTGVGGLIVRLYDKDLFFDDQLGEDETDESGRYTLTYRRADFRDFFESRPDLYVTILDRNGQTLATSKREVRHEAGRVEVIDVRLGEK